MNHILRSILLIFTASLALQSQDELAGRIRVEQIPVATGAELLTVFALAPARPGQSSATREIPLISILRDTLDDPASERLRQVWVLSYARPSIQQRLLAAVPFYYKRTGSSSVSLDRPPAAILDLSAPAKNTATGVAGAVMQSQLFNPEGIFWRAPSLGYRANAAQYRNAHIAEALEILSELRSHEGAALLTADEMNQVEARLSLSRRLLGGLVKSDHISQAAGHEQISTAVNRAHNWDLLRQRAEKNALYFEPLAIGEPEPGFALLWVAREDLERNRAKPFDGALLKIANPWKDASLENWKGYHETWYLDADGARVESNSPGSQPHDMIPLALYSLEYPPSPLLLVDFRDQWKPKQREMFVRAADFTATGLLGFTAFGNLAYLAGHTGLIFVRHRHGANVDRTSRVSAYADLHHELFFDATLDPNLKREIEKRLDHLSLNPFEHDEDQSVVPQRQYQALLAYARDPNGLPALLKRQRGREAVPLVHGPGERALFNTATILSFGIYRHREPDSPEILTRIEQKRQLDTAVAYLQRVASSSPRIDVAWDSAEVDRRLDQVAELTRSGREITPQMTALMAQIFRQTSDDDTRRLCLQALSNAHSGLSRRYFEQLSAERNAEVSAEASRSFTVPGSAQ